MMQYFILDWRKKFFIGLGVFYVVLGVFIFTDAEVLAIMQDITGKSVFWCRALFTLESVEQWGKRSVNRGEMGWQCSYSLWKVLLTRIIYPGMELHVGRKYIHHFNFVLLERNLESMCVCCVDPGHTKLNWGSIHKYMCVHVCVC